MCLGDIACALEGDALNELTLDVLEAKIWSTRGGSMIP